jgi:hypothetical protein
MTITNHLPTDKDYDYIIQSRTKTLNTLHYYIFAIESASQIDVSLDQRRIFTEKSQMIYHTPLNNLLDFHNSITKFIKVDIFLEIKDKTSYKYSHTIVLNTITDKIGTHI